MCFLVLAGGIGVILTTLADPPLVRSTDPLWGLANILYTSVGGLTLLAVIGMVALIVAQWHRYGLPPRTPPA